MRWVGTGMEKAYTLIDLLAEWLEWLTLHIEVPITVLIGAGVVYLIWLQGYQRGFVDGIKHHMRIAVYNSADIHPQYPPYAADNLLQQAREELHHEIHP